MRRLGWRRVVAFAASFYVALLVPDLGLRYVLNQLLPSMEEVVPYREKPGLYAKVDYYRRYADRFDTIYVGDSRTYTGIAPALLDPLLGTHSVNLSSIGNWFPTQYPSLQQILPLVPEGTLVVWSIGHQNFVRMQEEVNLTYPVGLANVPRYLGWGYPWSSLRTNLIDGLLGMKVFVWRHQIRVRLEGLLARNLRAGPAAAAAQEQPFERIAWRPVSGPDDGEIERRAQELMRAYRADPNNVHVEEIYDGSQVTSLAVYQRGGNYVRVELRPEFFRAKQEELAAEVKPIEGAFQPDAEYWKNFLAIVDLLAQHRVRLVVNEFEEAPYQYRIERNRKEYRAFMSGIAEFFRKRDVPFVRVDFEQLSDADYFDYNHLNSRGVERFTQMFAEQLRPMLPVDPAHDGVQ